MKNIAMLVLSVLFFGCQERKSDQLQSHQPKASTSKSIMVSPLPAIPSDIDGCSCLFSKDSTQFAAKRYLFASNYDSIAYLNIDEKVQRLKLKSSTRRANEFGDQDRVEEFENDFYSLKVILKYQKHSDLEVWSNAGELILKDKNGNVVNEKLFGECGC